MSVDKNQAVIDFLIQCPQVAGNPLFFNAITAEDNSNGIVTIANDKALDTPYIDGSVLKQFSFSLIAFKSVSYEPVPKAVLYTSENVDDLADVQSISDWVDEQNENRNYPDFGTDCVIDDMEMSSDVPSLNGIDTSVMPALAKYSFTINVNYLDITKKIFK